MLNINAIHSKFKWCAMQVIFMIRLFLFDSVFFVGFDAVFQVLKRLYFVFRCSLLDDKTRSISVWDWLKSEKSHFIIFRKLSKSQHIDTHHWSYWWTYLVYLAEMWKQGKNCITVNRHMDYLRIDDSFDALHISS